MWRAAAWLGIAALAALAHWYDSDALRGACAAGVLAACGVFAPRALQLGLFAMLCAALGVLAAAGIAALLNSVPALIAAFVAWLFARTLRPGRVPLIARAIGAIDGAAVLADPAVARYARRLTLVWAGWQTALALLATLLAVHAAVGFAWLPAWLPGPRRFGAIGLPLAVAALFLAEFALRPLWLPQVPRQRLFEFLRTLVRAWPSLLDER